VPALKFNNFSNLSFLQGIDKPRYLRPLLQPLADYFDRQGVNIAALDNTDETDRKLLEIFTQPDEDMPPVLQETLYVLDDLADGSGYERILDELGRSGSELDVEVTDDDLTPGEFALVVLEQQPQVIATCHAKVDSKKVRNYREFQSPSHGRLGLRRARRSRQRLERVLSPWFASRGRSAACEIYVYEEEGETKFQITHGKPYRSDGSIDKRLRRSRITYRPQKHDSVVYNNRTGVLKVGARWPKEIEQYRRTFGEVLFGHPEHFPPGEIYTLEPLQSGIEELQRPYGVEAARLKEVWREFGNVNYSLDISKGEDLLANVRRHDSPNLSAGQVIRAGFLVKYASGGKPRRLEVRPPNVAIYDRDRDGDVAEEFLRVNGFLLLDGNDATGLGAD